MKDIGYERKRSLLTLRGMCVQNESIMRLSLNTKRRKFVDNVEYFIN